MGAEKRPTQDHPDPLPPPTHQVTKTVDPPTPAPAAAQRLENMEKRMSAFERSTLLWAKAAVGVASIAALFACLQWVVMRKTLNEMKASGDVTASQTWKAIDNLNWAARSMDQSAKQAQKLVAPSEQMARDNGALLRDTQGPVMRFGIAIDTLRHDIDVTGENRSKIAAQWASDDLLITVRDWKTKKAVISPTSRQKKKGPIEPSVGPTPTTFNDYFPIPRLNKRNSEDLSSGKDYVTVEWSASYDDGFRGVRHIPRSCWAAISIESELCGKVTNTQPIAQYPCDAIDASVKLIQSRMSEAQKQCQKPN